MTSISKRDLEKVLEEKLTGIWQRGGVGRESLRELDDLWLGEVEPPNGIDELWGFQVFRDPSGEWLCTFGDKEGNAYVADFDEKDFVVANPRKLPVPYGPCSIIYEHNNRNWLMLSIAAGRYHLYRVSRDFSTVLESYSPLTATYPDGTVKEIPTGGTGQLLWFKSDRLLLVGDEGSLGTAVIIGDPSDLSKGFTVKPNPLIYDASEYIIRHGEAGHGYAPDGVGTPAMIGDFLVFPQNIHGTQFGGTCLLYGYWDEAKETLVGGFVPEVFLGYQVCGKVSEVGSRKVTQFLSIRHHVMAVVEEYYNESVDEHHRVYLLRIPWWMLSMRDKTIIWTLWHEQDIDADETSPAMPGFGRKTIHFTSDTSGDLTVYLDAVGNNDWKELLTLTGVTSALEQTLHSGLRMRLGFSTAAKVSAYVVCEP